MDEIQERLQECSKACIDSYMAWRANPAAQPARESLMEHVHELRKIAARLEIELAVADRRVSQNAPIPIPAHRAAGGRRGAVAAQSDVAREAPREKVQVKIRKGADEGEQKPSAPAPTEGAQAPEAASEKPARAGKTLGLNKRPVATDEGEEA